MSAKREEVGSFLAFLYHIRFTEDRERFRWPSNYQAGVLPPRQNGQKHSYEQVMDEFKLTPAQKDLMVAVDWAMSDPDPAARVKADALWQQLVLQLIPEFRQWTEGDRDIYPKAAPTASGGKTVAAPVPATEPKWW